MAENPYAYNPVADEEPVARPAVAPKLGGWLLLPAIGLTLSPILSAFALATSLNSEVLGQIEAIDANYPGFMIAWAILMVCDLLLTCFQVYVAYYFFKRYAKVPRLMIIMYCLNVSLAVISCIWFTAIFQELDPDETRTVGTAVIGAAIWIPYFLTSKRVKATFIINPASEHRFDSDGF